MDAWQELNERQQRYLAAAYHADQEREMQRRQAGAAGQWSRVPAAEWRWVIYGPTLPPSSLYRGLTEAGLVDQGTGATWEALASRGLIETRDQLLDVLQVKLTAKGRKAAREGLGIVAPKRRPAGQLRPRQWAALVAAYKAGVTGLASGALLNEFDWHQTIRRLRDGLNPPLLGYTAGRPEGRYRITEAGIAHYREQWALYRELYPEVRAPAPPLDAEA